MQSTSSASPVEPSIIRAGSDGRLRYTPDQRGELRAAFDRSGLSAMAFSSQHGIAYQSFIAWLRRRRRSGAPPARGWLPARPLWTACRTKDGLPLDLGDFPVDCAEARDRNGDRGDIGGVSTGWVIVPIQPAGGLAGLEVFLSGPPAQKKRSRRGPTPGGFCFFVKIPTPMGNRLCCFTLTLNPFARDSKG